MASILEASSARITSLPSRLILLALLINLNPAQSEGRLCMFVRGFIVWTWVVLAGTRQTHGWLFIAGFTVESAAPGRRHLLRALRSTESTLMKTMELPAECHQPPTAPGVYLPSVPIKQQADAR